MPSSTSGLSGRRALFDRAYRLTVASSVPLSTGLAKWALHPAATLASSASRMACAERATIGVGTCPCDFCHSQDQFGGAITIQSRHIQVHEDQVELGAGQDGVNRELAIADEFHLGRLPRK